MPVAVASRNMGLTRTGEVGWGVLGAAILYGVVVEGSCGYLGKSIPSQGDSKCKMHENTFKDQEGGLWLVWSEEDEVGGESRKEVREQDCAGGSRPY